ncbi:Spc24 subunit of Ndc80-domain-containing protein, partial [Chytridium lagenaria]
MMGVTPPTDLKPPPPQPQDDDNDPRLILPIILAQLDPTEDLTIISDIKRTLLTTEKLRQKTSNDTMDLLRSLSRDIDGVKRETGQMNRFVAEKEHRNRLALLDSKKFSTAKEIQDIHEIVEHLEEEKRQLTKELVELQKLENEEFRRKPDENGLRLQIFTQLGITAVVDDVTGNITKCLVSSSYKNEMTLIDINDETYSKYYYANVLWDMCS